MAKTATTIPDLAAFPKGGDCFRSACPTRAILSHVTGRWGSLVIAAIGEAGTLRFSQIRSRVEGISEKMLAQTLRELERDGLLLRTSRPVVPPHVDYELTALGRGVVSHVVALMRFIESHVLDLVGAQRARDACAEPASPPPAGISPPGVTVEARRASNLRS